MAPILGLRCAHHPLWIHTKKKLTTWPVVALGKASRPCCSPYPCAAVAVLSSAPVGKKKKKKKKQQQKAIGWSKVRPNNMWLWVRTPLPRSTPRKLLKRQEWSGNHPQERTLGFDPQPCEPITWAKYAGYVPLSSYVASCLKQLSLRQIKLCLALVFLPLWGPRRPFSCNTDHLHGNVDAKLWNQRGPRRGFRSVVGVLFLWPRIPDG